MARQSGIVSTEAATGTRALPSALARLSCDPRTRGCAARKQQEGNHQGDRLCLKRAIAPGVFQLITHPKPAGHHRCLRSQRHEQGVTSAKQHPILRQLRQISLAENGHLRDAAFHTAG